MQGESSSILWRRLDRPGHEAAHLFRTPSGWRLSGTAVIAERGQPCVLRYDIGCDPSWRTQSALVEGTLGMEQIRVEISVSADGRWHLNGDDVPEARGCIDVDLNFSPSTNLLPIRRLSLEVGEEAAVDAAWLRFPTFRLERLEQTYRRLSRDVYRYESAGGSFVADLRVDEEGMVLLYPGFCEAEPSGSS